MAGGQAMAKQSGVVIASNNADSRVRTSGIQCFTCGSFIVASDHPKSFSG